MSEIFTYVYSRLHEAARVAARALHESGVLLHESGSGKSLTERFEKCYLQNRSPEVTSGRIFPMATRNGKMAMAMKGCDAMRRTEAPAFMLTDAEGRNTKPALV